MERELPALETSAAAFGADAGGVPGRVGRSLHAHWAAVLAARAREAADAAARLTDLADSVRTTQHDYTDTDDSAAHQFRRAAP
ncbi:type VII secretion target [Actinoplanes sp. NPDC049265]|uniref:type VII secretion target n=1 Tax=Actinoplanes sp. NPDC049265 TaxID=3363902 RepID=UPI00371224E5